MSDPSPIDSAVVTPSSPRIPLIGEPAPAFDAVTTQGPIRFPGDYKGKWVILFSHPADFTPVCTTEFMTFATLMPQFEALNCKLIGLSIDSNFSHIASFDCSDFLQGYPSVLHGGVISSLLDGAMTHCMFAHGRVVVTAELRIRFRHPVVTGCEAKIRAWIEESWPPLHLVKAELVQRNQVMAKAEGKFVDRPIKSLSQNQESPSPAAAEGDLG